MYNGHTLHSEGKIKRLIISLPFDPTEILSSNLGKPVLTKWLLSSHHRAAGVCILHVLSVPRRSSLSDSSG